jgi:hypothetical protein
MNEVNLNRELYEEEDVERVMSNDWVIERFIIDRKGDLEQALERLKETMRWRKVEEVNQIKPTDFPQEFWLIGELYHYSEDKEGVVTCYSRARFHKKFNQWMDLSKRYVLAFIEASERRANGKWNFVWDCSGAGLFNMNMPLVTFFIQTLSKHYPGSFHRIYVHELPTVLWAVYQLLRGLFPEQYREAIVFVNKSSIIEQVGVDSLPDYLGGFCSRKYRGPVEGCIDIRSYVQKHGMTDEAANEFLHHYQKYIDM